MTSTKPPVKPWVRGSHPDKGYSCFSLEVKIAEDSYGWVFSEHDFTSPKDRELARSLSGGGEKQIAYGLLTEALRREVFLCLLVQLSKSPDYLDWYQQGDDDYRDGYESKITNAVSESISDITKKMTPDIVKEVIRMMQAQLDT